MITNLLISIDYVKKNDSASGLTCLIFISEKPPSFACHRTTPFTEQGTITYSSCNVRNKAMNARTGIFTVEVNIIMFDIIF